MPVLRDTVAIVTGAGRGLGRAYAIALAAAGARLVVNDAGCAPDGGGHDPGVAEAVAAEVRAGGGEAVANADAVGDDHAAARLTALALARFGRLDVLVNNAGITWSCPFDRFPTVEWERVLAVHLTGTFTCARTAFAAMRASGRGGRIINVASGAGIDQAYVGTAAYAAAKGGIVALSRVIAAEGANDGITCNVIAPLARTRMSASFLGDAAASLEPEAVAPLVVYLASELSAGVTGVLFRCRHGRIALSRFTTSAELAPQGARWTVEEIAARIGDLARRP